MNPPPAVPDRRVSPWLPCFLGAALAVAACGAPPPEEAGRVEESHAALTGVPGSASTILWRSPSTGQVTFEAMAGYLPFGGGEFVAAHTPGFRDWKVVGTGDFDGDGHGDLLWRNLATNQLAVWFMHGAHPRPTVPPDLGVAPVPLDKRVRIDVADFNGDGRSDILWSGEGTPPWKKTGGSVKVPDDASPSDGLRPTFWRITWLLDLTKPDPKLATSSTSSAKGRVAAVGRFGGGAGADVMSQAADTTVTFEFDNGTSLGMGKMPADWKASGVGDFTADGWSDVVWHNQKYGSVALWFIKNGQYDNGFGPGSAPAAEWQIIGTGDFDSNGRSDLLWRSASGAYSVWSMGHLQVSHFGLAIPKALDFEFAGTLETKAPLGKWSGTFAMRPHESDPQYVDCGEEPVTIESTSPGLPVTVTATGSATGVGFNLVCRHSVGPVMLLPGEYTLRSRTWARRFTVGAREVTSNHFEWKQPAPADLKNIKIGCENQRFEMIDGLGDRITIPNGERRGIIPIGGQTMTYFCDGRQRQLTCPAPASYVYVDREPNASNIVTCYTWQAVHLGRETGNCNEELVAAFHSKYALEDQSYELVARGAQASFNVTEPTFSWTCLSAHREAEARATIGIGCEIDANGGATSCKPTGSANEAFWKGMKDFFFPSRTPSTSCPQGTNYVYMTRPATGGTFEVSCHYIPR